MSERPTIMLVHGAWHGGWCWDALRPHLHAEGFRTAVVDNPSVTVPGSDLAADGVHLRRALDAIEGPIVVVGHSYGGAVVSEGGAHPNVERLVYLTAFTLDTGESLGQNALTGGEDMQLPAAMVFDGDTVAVDPSRAVEFFYHDCADDVAAAAVRQLRPMAMAAMGCAVGAAAWREVPASYIVCTDDRALPIALQRACAARVGDVREMPTSHSPFLSRPEDLARVLAEIVSA